MQPLLTSNHARNSRWPYGRSLGWLFSSSASNNRTSSTDRSRLNLTKTRLWVPKRGCRRDWHRGRDKNKQNPWTDAFSRRRFEWWQEARFVLGFVALDLALFTDRTPTHISSRMAEGTASVPRRRQLVRFSSCFTPVLSHVHLSTFKTNIVFVRNCLALSLEIRVYLTVPCNS